MHNVAAVNAIKISVYPNTYIYRSERQEDKYALLHAYHRTMDENSDRQDDATNPSKYKDRIGRKTSINAECLVGLRNGRVKMFIDYARVWYY